jgi:hypothetical protein
VKVELGDVNRPKASFVYDARYVSDSALLLHLCVTKSAAHHDSRFRQSLKAQLTEVLTTQTQALPEAVTPSLDAKKVLTELLW